MKIWFEELEISHDSPSEPTKSFVIYLQNNKGEIVHCSTAVKIANDMRAEEVEIIFKPIISSLINELYK